MNSMRESESTVTEEEYLHGGYEPEFDYVHGHLERRHGGELAHSTALRFLICQFCLKRAEWQIEAFPSLSMKLGPQHYRTADLVVIEAGRRFEGKLSSPPTIAIEIVSPEDRAGAFYCRMGDYARFGVKNIWIVDPTTRSAMTADRFGLHPVEAGELAVPGTPIRVVLAELFAELDR